MIAQVVGAGSLISLLSGGVIPPSLAIPLVGILMIIYVVVGGMLATTWVQIVKAALLMFATIVMTIIILNRSAGASRNLLGPGRGQKRS